MPSGSENLSWHPAFMPNSEQDRIAAESPESATLQTIEPLESSKSEIAPPPSNLDAHEQVPESTKEHEAAGDNEEHPELSNLRNTLTTSLASPGGVELDEDPLHNGVSYPEAQEEKADYPSEGPSHENKHLSTMSFARTVSGALDFGEDDEVDPEWSLNRQDSDPFKSMAQINRTNSFPQVPPTHAPGVNLDEHITHSQVGDIMQEVEQETRDLFTNDGDDGHDFFGRQDQPVDDPEDFLQEAQNETSTFEQTLNDYGQTYGGNVCEEIDEESQARFEEGLPLVQSSKAPAAIRVPPTGPIFGEDDGNDEEDFFTQVSKSDASLAEPPTFQRKSTMQIMDSLHFQPHEQTQNIVEEETMESSQSSLDKATGGGIAVSTSTVLSRVFGDPDSIIQEHPEQDLAERWKAALAEDEFLDEDDELLPDDDETEKSNGKVLDPFDLFGSDDEGFLEDADEQNTFPDISQQTSPLVPAAVTSPNETVQGFDSLTGAVQSNRPSSSSSRYLPASATTMAPQPADTYAPSAPLLTDLTRQTSSTSVPAAYMAPAIQNFQPQQQPRPEMPKAQSFADKAKGGYSSPYDLPMDVTKPRKRPSTQHINKGFTVAVPPPNAAPPRSSSMYSNQSNVSTSSLSPPTSSHSQQGQIQQLPQLPKTVRKTQSGFFEELPMAAKPRQAIRHASSFVSPSPNLYTPPNSAPHPPPPAGGLSPYQQPVQQPIQPTNAIPGLVAPERVSPYASLPTGNMAVPPVPSRYSPAPPQHSSQTGPPPPVAQSRYSPAPPNQRPLPSNIAQSASAPPMHPHQPRTSSPLAHFERSQDPRSHSEHSSYDRRTSSSYEPNLRPSHLSPTREVDENEQPADDVPNQYAQPPQSYSARPVSQTPPPSQSLASRGALSPSKRTGSNYLPQQPSTNPPQAFLPPQRSQTQSPGTAFAGPRLEMSSSDPYQRPASVELPSSPRAIGGFHPVSMTSQSRPRGFSQGLNYITPTDGREQDPLQRWRGAPVFAWGVGGTIVTSFPKDVPRYGIGQTQPMIVRSPGEVKTRNIKDVDPLPDRLTSFPGPLKGKSKKKDIIFWLTSGIQILEQNASYLRSLSNLSHQDKRTEERILLWKILRVFIENDGILEGNATVDKAVRDVLSPELEDVAASAAPLYATGADLSGISHSASGTRADPVDPSAVDQLRKHLLRGAREKAVWDAVDKRLWAHAMLISNTVSKDLYKQVAQEFVQKEVKNIGDNTESLAALYEIFAGNFEESIDELVPPSARAGFKMMSTSNTAGPSKGALDGLDRWRETLGLVLSNRSTDDTQALNALGKLLSGYGRAEAAHICFLFARSHTVFSGIDDPQTNVVLIGADHLRQPFEFDKEMEPILLTEVFEFGISLSGLSNLTLSSPYLAVYKLQHATILAEYGYREKALQYCEAIATSITSQTRRLPYHHALLVDALDDLNKRLKQSPKDETSSWISKPSIDKVSGSVWATFNKFVAGDGDDAASTGSGPGSAAEVGPFARIAGETPTISRSPSQSELYGSYGASGGAPVNGIPIPITKASSRYAPGGSYTPPALDHQGSYGSQPRTSFEGRSSSEHRRYEPQRQMSDHRPTSQPSNSYPQQNSSSYTPQSSYPAHGNAGFSDTSSPYPAQISTPVTEQPASNIYDSPQPLNHFDGQQQPTSYAPSQPSSRQPSTSYEPPASSGYEPPSSGYEPPSYEPATMNDEPDSPIDTRPKKKSVMDDDEYDTPALKKQPAAGEKTKAEKDREADEAFRKAAEADAAKAAQSPAKKGWVLGGWFGGGKKEQEMSQTNKPIRAKLGEASSFYYDAELKRWVNKKGGDTIPTPTATPPPPKSGPPRASSGPPAALGGLTSFPRPSNAPAQRAVSEMTNPSPLAQSDGSLPIEGGLAPPTMMRSASNGSATGPSPPGSSEQGQLGSSRPPSAPPSRPGTGMSNASDIDDLLGPAMVRKGAKGVVKGKRRGRGYVDVMGDK